MIRVAVVGCGYWGPNLVRNFTTLPDSEVALCCDLDPGRLRHMQSLYPHVRVTSDFADVLEDDSIDAVCIATPVRTHHQLGLACLKAGKHTLIEKPVAASSEETLSLIHEAERRNLVLMTGHTFVYTAAVNKIKDLITAGELGDLYYLQMTRVNLGLFQEDINVVWDLSPHDISILIYVLGARPIRVGAFGKCHIREGVEDVSFLNLQFPNNVSAHLHVSWMDPCKIRRTTVVGSRKMLVYDDVEQLEKIRVYDKGVSVQPHYDTFGEFHLAYRFGDIFTPRLDDAEPLKVQCQHFIECVASGKRARSDGWAGLEVVRVIESAQESLRRGGVPVDIDWEDADAPGSGVGKKVIGRVTPRKAASAKAAGA